MADGESDEEAEEPAVALGEGEPVEGAPLARIASRMHWPQERSSIDRKVGDVTIRTPDGPRELGAVLSETDESALNPALERTGQLLAAHSLLFAVGLAV